MSAPDAMGRARIRIAAADLLTCIGELRFHECWNEIGNLRELDGLDRFSVTRMEEAAKDIAASLGYRLVPIARPSELLIVKDMARYESLSPVFVEGCDHPEGFKPAVTTAPGFDGRVKQVAEDDREITTEIVLR